MGKSIIYTIRRILRSCDYGHFKECESGSSRSQGHREITWPDLIAPQFCIFYSWETRRLRLPESRLLQIKQRQICVSRGSPFSNISHACTTSAVCCAVQCSAVSDSFDPMDWSPPGSSVQGDSPGKNTGVGCHALLQGFFPTQGSNPSLPHCRRILSHLNHQGSTRILEWAA